MAIYTDNVGNIYTHDDDKLAFTAWIDSDPARLTQWLAAADAHRTWQEANPSAHPSEAKDAANTMFEEWVAYANASRTTSA